ncbi:MAG: hypothetical protein IJI61_06615 [Oscillospiraceae bacterium]|nr:hypothetical protein [Oscillospiraceae bacterium]
MRNRKEDFEDDGRTIADMNVDGMPWYEPKRQDNAEKIELTSSEQRALIGSALKAALLVAAIFGLVYFLFILFCTHVWFA